ncbi:hypothetical protein DFH06DRAFT_111720 [Mycena polygramma]|nr:hypothetical protein DFH06DRAFT_111720 [Mycena polygramma]
MHQALRMGNIAELPVSCRRYASNAGNRSLEDLRKLVSFVAKTPPPRPELLLPVYYQNLDTADIPTPDQLDSVTEHAAAIERAILALQGLARHREKFAISEPVALELWPRIWKWVHVLDAYYDCVRSVVPLSMKDTYGLLLGIIVDYSTMAASTPGVRVVVARAWRVFISLELSIKEHRFQDVMRFLYGDTESARPHNIQEYIEGAGGSPADFAALVVDHIDRTLSTGQPTRGLLLSEISIFSLTGLLCLLVENSGSGASLSTALFHCGIVDALTNLICMLAESYEKGAQELLLRCFQALAHNFDHFPGHAAVAESLHDDNLIVAITCCARNDRGGANNCLRYFLNTVLPRSMVSHSVLSVISRSVDIEDHLFPDPEPFPDSQLFQAWQKFNLLATNNSRVHQLYDEGAYTSVRGCDNMKCGKLCRRKEIKRCSSCHQTHYCSAVCQQIDWREDGHKNVCERLRILRHNLDQFTVRERSFLHALVHHGYETTIRQSCMDKIRLMHQLPGEPFYMLFDYTKTPGMPFVRSVKSDPPPDPNPSDSSAAQWADQLSRASRSGGRMELAVVLVADGLRTERCMMPIRTRTSVLYDGLMRIVDEIPPDADLSGLDSIILTQVNDLLFAREQSGEDVVQWSILYDV